MRLYVYVAKLRCDSRDVEDHVYLLIFVQHNPVNLQLPTLKPVLKNGVFLEHGVSESEGAIPYNMDLKNMPC